MKVLFNLNYVYLVSYNKQLLFRFKLLCKGYNINILYFKVRIYFK